MNFIDKTKSEIAEHLCYFILTENKLKFKRLVEQINLTGDKLLKLNPGQMKFLIQKLSETEKQKIKQRIQQIQDLHKKQTKIMHTRNNPTENFCVQPKSLKFNYPPPDFFKMRLNIYQEKVVCQKRFGENVANKLYPNRSLKKEEKERKRKTFHDRKKLHKPRTQKTLKIMNVQKFACKQKAWITQKEVREVLY